MQPFPHPSDATHKICWRLANWLQRYSSSKVWTTDGRRRTTTDDDRRTDDGALVYYKLTLWAFGSGELKIRTPEKVTVITLKFEQGGLISQRNASQRCRRNCKQYRPWSDCSWTAPLGALWSGSALFAQTYLSENLGSLQKDSNWPVQLEKLVRDITAIGVILFEPPLDKTNKMTVRTAKTQISLGIRPVWSESLLCTQWVAKDTFFIQTAKTLTRLSRCPGWSESSLGAHAILLVLSWGGSFRQQQNKGADQTHWMHKLIWAIVVHMFINRLYHDLAHTSLVMRKPVSAICEQQRPDQPAYPRSLISCFVLRCQHSIIHMLAKSRISRL